MNKILKAFLSFSFAVPFLVACNNGGSSSAQSSSSTTSSSYPSSSSSSSGGSSSSNTSDSGPTIADLLDDDDGKGTYSDEDNVNRYPNEEEYAVIQEKKRILNIGEKYTEGFENDYLHTKISPASVDDGASHSLVEETNVAITGKSLLIESDGVYSNAAVYFNGMKFASRGYYEITFKYRPLVDNGNFIMQFRSSSIGVASDVYTSFSGEKGIIGTHSFSVDLLSYTDYQLMVFPWEASGKVVLDDIAIERKASKPSISNCEITGNLVSGSTIGYTYSFDKDSSTEGVTVKHEWFLSLDESGLDRTVIETESDTLLLKEEYAGKYVGISLIPGYPYVGDRFDFYGSKRIDDVSLEDNRTIGLAEGGSFAEDFESDTDANGNILVKENKGSYGAVIADSSQALSGNKSLRFASKGNYSSINFSGVRFSSLGIYTISFDYRFETKGEAFYVQLRSLNPASGDYSNDKFASIDMSSVTVGTDYTFEAEYSLDDIDDYYLMMFPSVTGCSVLIDNLTITRGYKQNVEVKNVELAVGESLSHDFDSETPSLGFDFAQVPNSKVTSDTALTIDGKSLYFESAGSYKCLFINKGLTYTPNVTYKVSFRYKIISFCDTVYFQFNAGSTVYDQFGSIDEVGVISSYSHEFALGAATNYVMQIFPGGGISSTKIIFDDFIIERTK